ncbi:MAG TPA: ABC transporter ATP-binding protein, partial [Kiritimatiellia bacterium]|nr:ABC transporter ATP-binding protein [Kiritimatiellia bacterium]
MDNAIETTGLVKRYGARRALDGFTLSVPRFAVFGLVGPNGA